MKQMTRKQMIRVLKMQKRASSFSKDYDASELDDDELHRITGGQSHHPHRLHKEDSEIRRMTRRAGHANYLD